MQGEVRSQCTASARGMLAMTCKSEHADAAPRLHSHALLFALAQDKETRLVIRALSSPKFTLNRETSNNPPFHDIKHIAIRTKNGPLIRFLVSSAGHMHFEWRLCFQCLQCAMQSCNKSFITMLAKIYRTEEDNGDALESSANVLTVEAIRMNNVDLLKHLNTIEFLKHAFIINWNEYYDDGLIDPWSIALDWWDALVYMGNHDDCPEWQHSLIHKMLVNSMVSRQWTLDQMGSFFVDRIIPELGWGDVIEDDDSLDAKSAFFNHYSLRLFITAIAYKNMPIIDGIWTILARTTGALHPYYHDALNHLSLHDDTNGTLGRRLLRPVHVAGVLGITSATQVYIDRILARQRR